MKHIAHFDEYCSLLAINSRFENKRFEIVLHFALVVSMEFLPQGGSDILIIFLHMLARIFSEYPL